MIEKLRQKILGFINSPKDYPLLAGFSIGLYMMLFYYSRNFALANSVEQVLFFTAYYILMPAVVLLIGHKFLVKIKPSAARQFLFTGLLGFPAFFLLQLHTDNFILYAAIAVAAAIALSFWLKNYYKLFIILLAVMSVFNLKPLAGAAYKFAIASDEWKKLPDGIERARFKKTPNVYYIQPDGYAGFKSLRENPHYNIDNHDYESFLEENGFTLYDDYRSNYQSTLLSNSATFAMKHHYAAKDVESYAARSIIISDNPVLTTLRNNGYKTSIITQNPYLIMNRPKMGFDYCNIAYEDIPYIRDGFSIGGNVMGDFKAKAAKDAKSGNFYFVEKFLPGHISVFANGNTIEEEKKLYLDNLDKANVWLKEIITFIVKNDPEGIIIIGADHGGYCGFAAMQDVLAKTQDPALLQSVFGAQLAIRWNDPSHTAYDKELKTGVNLFRTLFSFLAEDKKYLRHLEDDGSYMPIKQPKGVFRFLDDNGKVVFDEK
jgi:hypothetical protein